MLPEAITHNSLFLWSVVGLFVFTFLVMGGFYLWVKSRKRKDVLCPYSETPLRRADTLHWRSKYKVEQFMKKVGGYDNLPFSFRKSSFSRETGRIFPKSVNWLGKMHVDWNFLKKRIPGDYVSWGSLTSDQKEEMKFLHGLSLQGFQTEYSSKNPSPMKVEKEYAMRKPGPLYVNLERKILLGWQSVPGSELEVLIVKRPLKRNYSNVWRRKRH